MPRPPHPQLNSLIILGREYKTHSSSSCICLHPPVTSSVIGVFLPNVFVFSFLKFCFYISINTNFPPLQNFCTSSAVPLNAELKELEKTKFYRMCRVPKSFLNYAFWKTGDFLYKGLLRFQFPCFPV
jgi:hypothetical protein